MRAREHRVPPCDEAVERLDEPREVRVAGLNTLDIAKVTTRSLQTHRDVPALVEQTQHGLPETVPLEVGESLALLLDLKTPHRSNRVLTETRVYSTDYLHAIEAGVPIRFTFEGLPPGEGDAVLRLAIGRVPVRSSTTSAMACGSSAAATRDYPTKR